MEGRRRGERLEGERREEGGGERGGEGGEGREEEEVGEGKNRSIHFINSQTLCLSL